MNAATDMIKLDERLIQDTTTLDLPAVSDEQLGATTALGTNDNPGRGLSGSATLGSVGLSYSSQILKVSLPLWVADMISIITASALGLLFATLCGLQVNHPVAFVSFIAAVYSASLFSAGLYPGLGLHPARELRMMFRSTAFTGVSMVFGLALLTNWGSPYVLAIAVGGLLQLVAMPLLRGAAKSWMLRKGIGIPVAFLGEKSSVERVYRDMKRFGNPMLQAAGRFSDGDADDEYEFDSEPSQQSIPLLGSADDLIPVSHSKGINWLMVVGDAATGYLDKNPSIISSFPEVIVSRASRSQVCAGSSVVNYGLASGIRLEESRLLPWARFVKRIVDIIISTTTLAILSPLFIAIAACIRISSPGPIFFGSKRVGIGGNVMKAWKFRSMVPNANKVLDDYLNEHPELQEEWDCAHKLKNDPRITWIGRIIRKTSLDELPQLWNVLVGDMSLVGPRPMLVDEIERYGDTYREYLMAKPGITGLWQVSGRNQTSYEERLEYVEFYVRHWSPWMDLYILIRTMRTVLFCEGAY